MALMSGSALRERLQTGLPLVGDGAIGTELMRLGVAPTDILAVNRTQPGALKRIHADYLEAGAEVLTANTFGVSGSEDLPVWLREGVRLAVEAAQECSRQIGVLMSLTPEMVVSQWEAVRFAVRQSLVWPDAILLETATSLRTTLQAVERVQIGLSPALLVVTCHYDPGGLMLDETSAEVAARSFEQAGVHAVGANCGEGSVGQLELAQTMREATTLPFVFQPNAGRPQPFAETQSSCPPFYPLYPLSERAFAQLGVSLWNVGVTLVGGCCGTTPAHIAALAQRKSC